MDPVTIHQNQNLGMIMYKKRERSGKIMHNPAMHDLKYDPLQKVLGQLLGIVVMALAQYDLPTKPTNIGIFCLGFLGICQQEVRHICQGLLAVLVDFCLQNWQTCQST